MRKCKCPEPREDGDPRRDHICVKCSGYLDPAWTTNNETVAEFLDRLEEGIFPWTTIVSHQGPPDWWQEFRLHCEQRELAGRHRFGHSFLARDNPREAQEEAADLALYMMLSLLSARREGDREEWELALTAAQHAAQAHRYAAALRAHRHEQFSDFPQP